MTFQTDTFELLGSQLTADQQELLRIAQAIKAWQNNTTPRLSDESMVRHYPGLGSTKTYRKLCNGKFESLVPETHLAKYKGVWHQLESATGSDGREEIYEDLTSLLECREAAAGLIQQLGRERFLIVEGPTGSGKTVSLQFVCGLYPGQAKYVEARETWSSVNCMLGDLLVAVGVYAENDEKMPTSKGQRLVELMAYLNQNRTLLAIDEGHHMVAGCLDILKSLSNTTPTQIIIAAIDTLWHKLSRKAWQEAAQIVYNRLYERIRLAPPNAEETELFLSRRVPALEGIPLGGAAARVASMAAAAGYFSFLRRLGKSLNLYTDTLTPGVVVSVAEEIQKILHTR